MKRLHSMLVFFGVDFKKMFISITGLFKYFRELKKIKIQLNNYDLFKLGKKYPILNEWNDQAGSSTGHYFHQDLFIAQLIFENNPQQHIDVGSRIDGFVAHVAAYRKIKVLDIRDVKLNSKNIEFIKSDLMNIQSSLVNSVDSISSLDVLEHFGLGRYGDSIDYFGYLKGFNNITNILKKD